jgi:hypothetical protein
MRQRRVPPLLISTLLLLCLLAGHDRLARPAHAAHALVALTRPGTLAAPCAATLWARLRAAEAWAWALCFDQPGSCPPLFAAQLSRHIGGGWRTCGAQAAGP